jgi:hypothetical protein
MKVNPGALSSNGPKIISETRTDLAEAHFKLMQEAKNSIDLKGPNATEMGDKTGGLERGLRQGHHRQPARRHDADRRPDGQSPPPGQAVFRKIWNRIRQYWTAEKWIRVTDDERNVKWVGMNVDPQQFKC